MTLDLIKSFVETANNRDCDFPLNNLPFGLYSLKGDSLGSPKLDVSFHIFIFWAKFAGKLNKNHVKVWDNQATNNTKTSIRVYKINMDFQEHWGEEVTRQLEAK